MITPANTASPSTASPAADGSLDKFGAASRNSDPGLASTRPQSSGAVSARNGDTAKHNEDAFGRVVEGAHHTIDRIADSAAPAAHKLQEGVATMSNELHHRADQVREKGDQWAESLRCTVRDNPLTSVATALAIGMVISRMTR